MKLHGVTAAGKTEPPAPHRQSILDPHARAHLVPLPVHALVLVRAAQRVHVVLELGLGVDEITAARTVSVLVERGDGDWIVHSGFTSRV